MKKLAAFLIALCALGTAHAVATCDQIVQQIDVWGNQVPKIVAVPAGCAGTQGVMIYDITAQQMKLYTIDGTLRYVSGVLGVNPAGLPSSTFDFAFPSTRTLSLSTDYQSGTPAKAAVISISPSCSAALLLSGGATCTLEARVGPSTLTCSTGTVVMTWSNGNTGTLTVGLNTLQTIGAPADIKLPIGGHFILCPISGTFTITTAVEQAAG